MLHTSKVFQSHLTHQFLAGCCIQHMMCIQLMMNRMRGRSVCSLTKGLWANSSSLSPSLFFPSLPYSGNSYRSWYPGWDWPKLSGPPKGWPTGSGVNNLGVLKRQRKESNLNHTVNRKLLSAPNHSHYIRRLVRCPSLFYTKVLEALIQWQIHTWRLFNVSVN